MVRISACLAGSCGPTRRFSVDENVEPATRRRLPRAFQGEQRRVVAARIRDQRARATAPRRARSPVGYTCRQEVRSGTSARAPPRAHRNAPQAMTRTPASRASSPAPPPPAAAPEHDVGIARHVRAERHDRPSIAAPAPSARAERRLADDTPRSLRRNAATAPQQLCPGVAGRSATHRAAARARRRRRPRALN